MKTLIGANLRLPCEDGDMLRTKEMFIANSKPDDPDKAEKIPALAYVTFISLDSHVDHKKSRVFVHVKFFHGGKIFYFNLLDKTEDNLSLLRQWNHFPTIMRKKKIQEVFNYYFEIFESEDE